MRSLMKCGEIRNIAPTGQEKNCDSCLKLLKRPIRHPGNAAWPPAAPRLEARPRIPTKSGALRAEQAAFTPKGRRFYRKNGAVFPNKILRSPQKISRTIINRTRVRLIIVQEKVQEELHETLEGFCKTFGKIPPPAGANSREAADAWKQSREKRNLHDASLPRNFPANRLAFSPRTSPEALPAIGVPLGSSVQKALRKPTSSRSGATRTLFLHALCPAFWR